MMKVIHIVLDIFVVKCDFFKKIVAVENQWWGQ
jgi:hypothetical protein